MTSEAQSAADDAARSMGPRPGKPLEDTQKVRKATAAEELGNCPAFSGSAGICYREWLISELASGVDATRSEFANPTTRRAASIAIIRFADDLLEAMVAVDQDREEK